MRYVCIHYLDDYLRAVLGRACPTPDINGVLVVRMHPQVVGEDRVVCEVEAPTEEAFLCWINEVNGGRQVGYAHPAGGPEDRESCSAYAPLSDTTDSMASSEDKKGGDNRWRTRSKGPSRRSR